MVRTKKLKKRKNNKTFKTKYGSQQFSSKKMPLVHPLRYRAMRLVDNYSKISDFRKKSLLRKLVREEYERRLLLLMKKSSNRKVFKKETKKNWKKTIKLSKYSSKTIEKIYFAILEKRR
jgi:hypothetical protein